MTTRIPVTIIGLGSMGSALAQTLLRAGHPTTVWNRTASKADDLVTQGAVRAETVRDAVAGTDLLIAVVVQYETLRGILDSAEGTLAGKTLVNFTNGTPEQARELAAWAERQGLEYVDGGIMAVPAMIGGPEAFILYSGSQAAFDRYQPTLARLGATRYLGTDPGRAPLYDLALLSGLYGLAGGAGHAAAMVGADAAEFTETLFVPWIKALVGILAPEVTAGSSEGSPLDMQAVVIDNIVQASRGQGLGTGTLTHLLPIMQLIVGTGVGAQLKPLIEQIKEA
ncbi:NAD(P)-dependent oxidoreductase [Actinomadura rudentiformis]|uniref:NAD(P)-dependent oxidoreductase n=1 Tax=Actinomadura rudentiformis TaxID=359158 RepID=A0A6H9Z780_9ACTN|nr:NAD(P)-binding domain-containing protein [Actinomadura rudentiformis]KAB2350838.1 NAD(P)-dependent oxidoreductase [Actinomadura rudentiformis]